jgi:hypothetical protein
MVAAGRMLGPDQKVILHLLDIPPAAQALEGVKMELLDAAFPLLEGGSGGTVGGRESAGRGRSGGAARAGRQQVELLDAAFRCWNVGGGGGGIRGAQQAADEESKVAAGPFLRWGASAATDAPATGRPRAPPLEPAPPNPPTTPTTSQASSPAPTPTRPARASTSP